VVPSEYCQSLVSWWRNARGDVEEGGGWLVYRFLSLLVARLDWDCLGP